VPNYLRLRLALQKPGDEQRFEREQRLRELLERGVSPVVPP